MSDIRQLANEVILTAEELREDFAEISLDLELRSLRRDLDEHKRSLNRATEFGILSEVKRAPLSEMKRAPLSGTFSGWASRYGEIDDVNDIVEPGAYRATLLKQGNKRPLLWQHDLAQPIGTVTLSDRAEGLWAEGKLTMESPRAQEAAALIADGAVGAMSIGYKVVRSHKSIGGPRRLQEIDLAEVSIVTIGALGSARIISTKSTAAELNAALAELREALSWAA